MEDGAWACFRGATGSSSGPIAVRTTAGGKRTLGPVRPVFCYSGEKPKLGSGRKRGQAGCLVAQSRAREREVAAGASRPILCCYVPPYFSESKISAARNQAVKFSGYWRICSCSIWARHRFLPLRRGTKSSACLPSTIIGVIPIVGKLSLRRIRPHPLSRRNCHFEALAFPVFR